jgi:hypothetical protein
MTMAQGRSPAAPSDVEAQLAALRLSDIELIVDALAAARAQGADITRIRADLSALHITRAPASAYVDLLAAALSQWADRAADTPDGQPSRLKTEIPGTSAVAPLSMALERLDTALHPLGARATYGEPLDHAKTAEPSRVGFLAPRIETLAGSSLAGSPTSPRPTARTDLRGAQQSAALLDITAVDAEPVMGQPGDLEQVVLATLQKADTFMSVRELLSVTMPWKKVRYQQVKTAAEALKTRGELLRDTHGAAHRYRINPDTDDHLAHHIFTLLAGRPDAQTILDKACSLLANQG